MATTEQNVLFERQIVLCCWSESAWCKDLIFEMNIEHYAKVLDNLKDKEEELLKGII